MPKLPRGNGGDERSVFPSASQRERWGNCPSSYWLNKRLAEQGNEVTETAEMASGTLIHAALANEISADALCEEDYVKFDKLVLHESNIAFNYLERGWEKIDEVLEERYWYNMGSGIDEGTMLMSGKPDVVNLYKSIHYDKTKYHVVILDYKSGYTGPVTRAEHNAQLEALIGILHSLCDFKVDSWETWIVHTEGSNCAVYGNEEAWQIRQSLGYELNQIASHQLATELKPEDGQYALGGHCLWCNAKGICPVAVKTTQMTVAETAETKVAELTGDKLSEFLDKLPLAEKVFEEIKKAAREKLEADPDSVPGWKLQAGSTRRSIKDPEELLNQLNTRGIEVKAKINLSVAEVEKAIRKHTNTEGIDLSDYIKTTRTKPSLRKQKGGDK